MVAALKAADDAWQEALDRRAKLCDAEETVSKTFVITLILTLTLTLTLTITLSRCARQWTR